MWIKSALGIFFLLIASSGFTQDVFEAARTGNIKQLKRLIEINPDTLKATNEMGFDPLMIACYRGETKCAQFLVNEGANVNGISPEGNALLAAAYQNNTKLTIFLLNNKAELNRQGPDGNTALMYAVMNQNMKMVQALIKANADLTVKNKDGQTAHSLALSLSNPEIQKKVEIK
jgi:ankyrin repeat protein